MTNSTLTKQAAWTIAEQLAAEHGLALERLDFDRHDFAYNGACQVLRANSAGNAIHELAHWLVASPARRRIVEYGLGAGPDCLGGGGLANAACSLSDRFAEVEEGRASLLGVILEAAAGLPFKQTLHDHSWPDAQPSKVRRIIRWLSRRGLVTAKHASAVGLVLRGHRHGRRYWR